mmetsp:Transcript_36582/g.97834  ORF Transcript_36582/g.97834 Transcript_36582/m.97834 type:complete len:219 (+) Transcript_36582:222-878(+)
MVDSQVAVVHDLSVRIGQQLTDQVAYIEQRPRDEASSLKVTHAKLGKDYNRVLQQFRVAEDMARQKQRAMGSRNRGAGTESGGRVVRDRAVVKQDERLRVQMQEQAINEAIVREREDEIREIHQNVTKVNEVGHLQYANPTGRQMRNPPGHARRVRASLLVDPTHLPQIFKDLAEIVNDQQEDINTVEAMIEKSHAHARSGLDQVEKANEHQQGCVVS